MPLTPSPSTGTVAIPDIEGPVSGGSGAPFVASTVFDLAQVGYERAEFFLAGTATAWADAGPFGADGRWPIAPAAQAAYKTRIVVHRPRDASRFNGTVVVEWLNVSGGLDSAPDWITGHTELIRSGFAWVGVSAQVVGVQGGPSPLGLPSMPLREMDPVRYATLFHPGDSFSYDIFSQVAQAIRRPTGAKPLGDLEIEAVIAAGESQSAFRLVTYINAVHPVARVYDGFLVHSRPGTGAALSEDPQPRIGVPENAPIRTDLDVPVLTFQTETDLILLNSVAARQEDTPHLRLWEVAGTAHADTYTVAVGATDLGDSPAVAALVLTRKPVPIFDLECERPINSGPQHWVLKAALAALNEWVRRGTPPPCAPRLEVAGGAIVRDTHGNAVGGIRTPSVDVPIATLSGDSQPGSLFASLFGSTEPFEPAKLAALYPSHEAYVAAFDAAVDRAVQAGFLLPPDAALMKAAAASSDIR